MKSKEPVFAPYRMVNSSMNLQVARGSHLPAARQPTQNGAHGVTRHHPQPEVHTVLIRFVDNCTIFGLLPLTEARAGMRVGDPYLGNVNKPNKRGSYFKFASLRRRLRGSWKAALSQIQSPPTHVGGYGPGD